MFSQDLGTSLYKTLNHDSMEGNWTQKIDGKLRSKQDCKALDVCFLTKASLRHFSNTT